MADSALSTGTLIAGRYVLERPLGEGGMGTVWAAKHTVTRRSVAIKFLKESARHRPTARQRFVREATAASALRHPNVVEILDAFDLDDGTPVMVMELLQGETLGSKIERAERLSVEETAAIMLPVLSAVGTAHASGIVHRDLKPDNVFIVDAGERPVIKVLDFGIAKLTAEIHSSPGNNPRLTDTGSVLGTPSYMAPEQASGDGVADYRVDIWSLGVIFYECLSGVRPIEGDNMAQVISRLLTAGITPLDRLTPELPSEVTSTVTHMLSRDPTRRPSLQEVLAIFGRYTRARPPAFGAPASPQVVVGADANARAPTLLATPHALVSSIPDVPPNAEQGSVRRSNRLTYGVLVAVPLTLVAALLLSRREPRGEAKLDVPRVAASFSALPAITSSPREAPPAQAPALSGDVASASSAAHTLPKPPKKPTKLQRAAPSNNKALNEEDLFSGRK